LRQARDAHLCAVNPGEAGHEPRKDSRRRVVRAAAFGVALAAALVVVTSFPFASGASVGGHSVAATIAGYPQGEANQMWSYQQFLAPDQDSLDLLNRMGVDLGESIERNPDGTMGSTPS
jgi:hypothetical protein